MEIANNILENVKQLINNLNEQIQSQQEVDVNTLQEEIRVIDMLIHSITRIKKFEQSC